MFRLQDGTNVETKENKYYRIGVFTETGSHETFYFATPRDIKNYLKSGHELDYVVEMHAPPERNQSKKKR